MSLEDERRFCRYHRVLNRAVWPSREASRVLLGLLVEASCPKDRWFWASTIRWRGGGKEDFCQRHLPRPGALKPSALRQDECSQTGMSSTLGAVPWASRVWSLPFLSALAYSERYAQEQGKRHKTLTDWAGQLLLLVRRWYPEREIVAVADGGYAALKLLDCCRSLSEPITFITRLRLDAALSPARATPLWSDRTASSERRSLTKPLGPRGRPNH